MHAINTVLCYIIHDNQSTSSTTRLYFADAIYRTTYQNDGDNPKISVNALCLYSLKPSHHSIRILFRLRLSTQIACDCLTFGQYVENRLLYSMCVFSQTHMLQHHNATEQ